MSDPLILFGVFLIAAALSFGLLGRKSSEPAARRSSSRPPGHPSSSRPPKLPKLEELAPPKKPSVRPMPQAAETSAEPRKSPSIPVSPLLAEALAENEEAYSTPSRPDETPDPLAAVRSRGHKPTFIYERGAEQDEQTGPLARVLIEAVGDTDRGRRRARNEDALLLMPEQGLFAIADGMGGYNGGQVASTLAVDSLRETFETPLPPAPTGGGPRRAIEVASAMQRANDAVFRAARAQPDLRDMGTTLVALRFVPNKQRLYVGHVGDSRCYRLRNGELRQLTTDHALKELGLTGPRANDLFKAIGIENEVAVDVVVDKPLPGDVYLLCSDGLPKMVDDERIRELLMNEEDPEAAVYGLIEKANDAGGKDNVTVLLAKVSAPVSAHSGVT